MNMRHQHNGFTLIELMVVIVIISIVAALVVMNISGVDQRKAMQAREILMLDLARIQRESVDQGMVLALKVEPASELHPFRYSVQQYQGRTDTDINRPRLALQNEQLWREFNNFPLRELPDAVSFQLEPEQYDFENANNTDLLGDNAPRLIWLGNGEVRPVTIQMYYAQKPVGDLIKVNYLGRINED